MDRLTKLSSYLIFLKSPYAAFALFVSLHILLYGFIQQFHGITPFHNINYVFNAHHYLPDARINGGPFGFLRALGQYDAQWYLKIADRGYPFAPRTINMNAKSAMDGLTYAFFPLYPLLIHITQSVVKNVEVAAFLLANMLLVADFFSIYFVVRSLFSKAVALKTIFLLFLFPFSIFYRSYFTEGLELFLLTWFCYFLIKKQFFITALFLALLDVSRGNVWILNLLYLYYLWQAVRTKQLLLKQAVAYFTVSLLPLIAWLAFNYQQTGTPFYFYNVRAAWFSAPSFLLVPFYNLFTIILFPVLPVHAFHYSQIDILVVFLLLGLLIKSKSVLPKVLWWTSFLLWLAPLITTSLMSFTRYQIISFPIFIYLALKLKQPYYLIAVTVLTISLFLTSILFVNWYWLG